jgi:predicted MFS family arabinose efflux permease
MSAPAAGLPARTVFDGWRSISVALYMALVGYGVLVGIPVIGTAWVELLGFSEEQVGRVAGADLGGLALGSVLASLVMGRFDRRLLALLGVIVAVAANGLCLQFTDYMPTLWLRLMAGTGAGIYTAVAIATLGASSRPARAFNLMLFAFAFSQAGEMQVLPMLSMNGIFWVFMGTFGLTLLFLHWIPARPLPRATPAMASQLQAARERVPAYLPWLCLAAIFFTYINIGGYWTYIELASLDAGMDGEWVGRLLVIVSLGSFLGCLVATLISNRWGLARPLLLTLAIMTGIVGILGFGIDQPRLLVSLVMFNFLWVFIDVYQMATVAVIDRSGAYASLMPAAQGLGQLVGPNLAASMLGWGLGYHWVFIMCAAAAFIGMLIYALMYLWLKRDVPLLAEAS